MPSSSNELVSVYIPTRNRVELLERALDSVLTQTHDEIEIIVVDDASEDGTQDLLERYSNAHKNIVCLRNQSPLGACGSRNRAIFAARGSFITGLDDDDEFLPDRIQLFVDHYDPKFSCLAAHSISCTAAGDEHRVSRSSRVVSFDDMLYFNHLGNQVFCPTGTLRALGGFNADYPAWQDYELWTRLIARYGDALRIPQHTQRVDQGHGFERISGRDAVVAALAMYQAQFDPLMSNAHRRAQRLLVEVVYPRRKGKLTLSSWVALASLAGSPAFRELLGRTLYFKFPEAVHWLSRLRAER